MAIKVESTHPVEGVLAEANGTISRETITVVSGQNLRAMSVVGKITASGKYKNAQGGASDGSQTAAGVLLYAVDASGGDAKGVILARHAEVLTSALQFESSEDAGEQAAHITALAALTIIARAGV